MPDLSGKNVLVTGGTRGIGKAMVEAFAEAGARVAFTYRSSSDEAEALKKQLSEQGTDVLVFQGDASRDGFGRRGCGRGNRGVGLD